MDISLLSALTLMLAVWAVAVAGDCVTDPVTMLCILDPNQG